MRKYYKMKMYLASITKPGNYGVNLINDIHCTICM